MLVLRNTTDMSASGIETPENVTRVFISTSRRVLESSLLDCRYTDAFHGRDAPTIARGSSLEGAPSILRKTDVQKKHTLNRTRNRDAYVKNEPSEKKKTNDKQTTLILAYR